MRTLNAVFENRAASMSDRLGTKGGFNRCGDFSITTGYAVLLMHPGIPLPNASMFGAEQDVWPRDISSIVLCINHLLATAMTDPSRRMSLYIHDQSNPSGVPAFLGGITVTKELTAAGKNYEFLEEISLKDLEQTFRLLHLQQDNPVANRIWTITVVKKQSRYTSDLLYVSVGAFLIILASIILVFWVHSNDRRSRRYSKERAQAEQEKAALILENARQATRTERNPGKARKDFEDLYRIAAMVACTFVHSALQKDPPLRNEELEVARGDVKIIDNSLNFVNDLLRNMLDMHRAASKQLHVDIAPVDLLHDVLEAVGGMLHQRGSKIKLLLDCPETLVVMADRLRLKQVILNLGRNSTTFVESGFIRLKAEEVDGRIKIYVEDSGSGIPMEKRERLYAKFQESLDLLSQGTGIGLFLCKNLVELMGGTISLDDEYNSGVPGSPGTRFVVDLCAGSSSPSSWEVEEGNPHIPKAFPLSRIRSHDSEDQIDSAPADLPECLSVLFVDDDAVLRKLFTRAVQRIRPQWKVRHAANGETALRLVEEESFDVIFMDMYMASVEKQLLGTETVAALRQNGIKSRICGLSGNDKEQEFFDAGADAFMFKPFLAMRCLSPMRFKAYCIRNKMSDFIYQYFQEEIFFF